MIFVLMPTCLEVMPESCSACPYMYVNDDIPSRTVWICGFTGERLQEQFDSSLFSALDILEETGEQCPLVIEEEDDD